MNSVCPATNQNLAAPILKLLVRFGLTAVLSFCCLASLSLAAADSLGPTGSEVQLAGGPVVDQLYDHGNPTAEEQLMLELVNRARANPTAEAERSGIDLNEGVPADHTISPDPKQPLAFNVHIIEAARGHSQWMLDNDKFAHVQDDGPTPIDPGDRMRAAGYVFSGSWTYGENIAFRSTTGPALPVGPTVAGEHSDLFIDKGIEDRGHRVSLMNGNFREIGIGVGLGLYTAQGRDFKAVMVTQDFGATDANPGPFLVGVVYRDMDEDKFYTPGEGLAGVTVKPAGGNYRAITSASGGYAVPITGLNGTLQVAFSDGPLTSPVNKPVVLTGQNVKLDFEMTIDAVPSVQFVAGSAQRNSKGQFEVDLQGADNTRVTIQGSENLVQWNDLAEITLGVAPTRFTDAQSPPPARRYYRAILFRR